jgi:hypothetical protein
MCASSWSLAKVILSWTVSETYKKQLHVCLINQAISNKYTNFGNILGILDMCQTNLS